MDSHDNSRAGIPASLHVATDDVPFAEDYVAPGLKLKLLQADVEGGIMTVRISFPPGLQLPPHKHTGAVHAYTLSGEWMYLEYTDSPTNKSGSYLYEPPGSTHTLKVLDDVKGETDVLFIVYGAMLFLDDKGAVSAVVDASSQLADWVAAIRVQGKPMYPFIVGGQAGYYQDSAT